MADEAMTAKGAILEQLSAHFELMAEAVSGFRGQLDTLRQELVGQFTEVGRQIRFLSEQIGENRQGIASLRADLGAEMVRLGETLGATRVEFREQLAAIGNTLHKKIENQAAEVREQVHAQLAQSAAEMQARLGDEFDGARDGIREQVGAALDRLRCEMAETGKQMLSPGQEHIAAASDALRAEIHGGLKGATAELQAGMVSSSESILKKLGAELKQTNKALASLSRKFDRFDDRVTIQTKDHEQRMRKLERQTATR